MRRFLSRLFKDERGAAVVEMAFVAPAIAGLAFASFNLWDAAVRHQKMDRAVEASAQYYLNGGYDDDDARTLGLSAWQDKPQTSDIQISRSCLCGGSGSSCNTLCTATSTPPKVYITIAASSTLNSAVLQPTQSRQETVRVR